MLSASLRNTKGASKGANADALCGVSCFPPSPSAVSVSHSALSSITTMMMHPGAFHLQEPKLKQSCNKAVAKEHSPFNIPSASPGEYRLRSHFGARLLR